MGQVTIITDQRTQNSMFNTTIYGVPTSIAVDVMSTAEGTETGEFRFDLTLSDPMIGIVVQVTKKFDTTGVEKTPIEDIVHLKYQNAIKTIVAILVADHADSERCIERIGLQAFTEPVVPEPVSEADTTI